ncbi:hypothetical protein ETD83_17555 [Actinomadura soli]|uniref:Uncharacterized protein n=1 Tax=Actinomadura soli TaxID=2508997 RepID=A0A5C4JAU7_9ACTN|nr:hypothetical protein [Actinomadura soli]TMR00144.1 hypothetical protein ETD83_17555 [Actinomadura soli]
MAMKADAALHALSQRLRIYDGMAATVYDNQLRVTRWFPDGERRTTITCSLRPRDGDHLWFWDAQRRPITEAENVSDAALRIAADMALLPPVSAAGTRGTPAERGGQDCGRGGAS